MRSFKQHTIILIICLLSASLTAQINELKKVRDKGREYLDPSSGTNYFSKTPFVNPFIGTGGHGHTYPGASMPFGMIQLSPDTRYDGWDGCSGYHYSDSVIYGFSHTHLSGTGVPDYCDLLVVPQNGIPKVDPGYLVHDGYGSRFRHETEKAAPGIYQVHLDDGNIDVDLCVTDRCGFHTYTFNEKAGKKFILIDLDHRDKLLDAHINIIDKHTISGKRISEGWAREQHFYFYLETDSPFQSARQINKNGKHKLLLTFTKKTNTIRIRVGISAVDIDGAKKNLQSEIPHWDARQIKVAATRLWNAELDKISFYSPDKEVMTNFYTALYHSLLNPNLFNDADGRYRGRDNNIHQLNESEDKYYTVFSLWDTYRATHPLFTLTQVDRTNDFIRTFLLQYDQGGDLPVWELAANETECMIGYHSVSVIADAWIKGIRGYNGQRALEAMIATSRFDEYGKRQFHEQGFIGSGDEPESVSKTLEYAYDDFCIAQMARNLSKDEINDTALTYYTNSLNFINVFDPQSGFMRARQNGIWHHPFDPAEVNYNYTEANSWQYSLYAPHAISVLAELMGGRDSLEGWLDRLFNTDSDLAGRHQVDITGLIGQYAHGNEPSHHMAYLYNYTNASYKSQFYLDSILSTMYRNAPDGLSGNEDCGQMSSWYVLSALGLYQVTPGHPWYDFGRPLMNNAVIQLENGNKIEIRVLNNSAENLFVQKITWNGRLRRGKQIHHGELIKGGVLIFEMGPNPPENRPDPNMSAILPISFYNFVPLPFFSQDQRVFVDSLTVVLSHQRPIRKQSSTIEYRLTSDTGRIYVYHEPFTLYETTEIEARQVDTYIVDPDDTSFIYNAIYYSPWIRAKFFRRDNSKVLELKSAYDNQYAAAGSDALIDGIRGGNEYRTGDWQGYWAKDVVAEISLDTPKNITELGIGCLRDMKSWIFYPKEIIFEVSNGTDEYVEAGRIEVNGFDRPDQGPEHRDFKITPDNAESITKIRITVKNYGKCPKWHLGAGNDTWLFLDEIVVN